MGKTTMDLTRPQMHYCHVCEKEHEHTQWREHDHFDNDKGRIVDWRECGEHFRPKPIGGTTRLRDHDPEEVFGPIAKGYKKEWLKDVKV